MRRTGFSTEGLPPHARASGYQTAVRDFLAACDIWARVTVDADEPTGFAAGFERFSIGRLDGAAHRTNQPHSVLAGPPGVRAGGYDFYLVKQGAMRFSTRDGDIRLQAGDMALLRTDDAFNAHSDQLDMIAVSLPQGLITSHALGPRILANRVLAGGAGLSACLAVMMSTAAQRHHELAGDAAMVLQTALLDAMLCLAAAPDAGDLDLSDRQADLLGRLKAAAIEALDDPDLTPQAVARAAGVSVRTLHRLFNASGVTFRVWLRTQRLERCWRELADPGRRRATIAAVAFQWGFNDLSTFNRAFRDHYGQTPQAVRQGLALSADGAGVRRRDSAAPGH